jgi:hypothetical protein
LLFLTGFTALAMEVVWTRAFTPVLQTQVYSFALILFVYLGATFLGSSIYRRDLRQDSIRSVPVLLAVISVAAFLPIVLDDLRFLITSLDTIAEWGRFVVLLSICPFCAALGYLTPRLIDGYALGDPAAAGRALVSLDDRNDFNCNDRLVSGLFRRFRSFHFQELRTYRDSAGLRRVSRFHGERFGQTAFCERNRHDTSRAAHQIHGSFAARAAQRRAKIGVDHLFRDGYELSVGSQLGR